MLRKFKFYLLGLIPGLVLVFFILNQKGASCSGYLPNSRVIAETLSKKFEYQPAFQHEMQAQKITPDFLKDSIITKGKIDFKKSKVQNTPCPEYSLSYPEKNPRYEVGYSKCADKVILKSLKKLR